MTESSLEVSNREAAEVAKTEDRVDLKDLHEKIQTIEYIRPESARTLTLAIVTLDNGFTVTGESACADPKNFNEKLGQKFAAENAVRKIWQLEEYLLRERLSLGEEA